MVVIALSSANREKLESELLLNRGGGICYNAARVESDERAATLFIGLGGTGTDMLLRIKNTVMRRTVLPKDENGRIAANAPRNIGFLVLDTDEKTQERSYGGAILDMAAAEFCSISVDGLNRVTAAIKNIVAEDNDSTWDWFDGSNPTNSYYTGAIRQLGRLMLFVNVDKVFQEMKGKIAALTRDIRRLNVIFLTGIAGGTGSGTILDMAYLVRRAMEDTGIVNGDIFGYLVLPEVNLAAVNSIDGGFHMKLDANAFACLKELNYWMEPGLQGDRFEQRYSPRLSVSSTARVFDFCHLLSAHDMDGMNLTYDKVLGGLAEYIFACISDEDNHNAAGISSAALMYEQLWQRLHNFSYNTPIPAWYMAIGAQVQEVPVDDIATLLAVRLFERLAPTFDQRPTGESFAIDRMILQLDPHELIDRSLLEGINADTMGDSQNYTYRQIWGGDNSSPEDNGAFLDMYNWYYREYQVKVTRNKAHFPQQKNDIFLKYVQAAIKRLDRGPCYLTSLIKSDKNYCLIADLDRDADQCLRCADTANAERRILKAQLDKAYQDGIGVKLRRKAALEHYIGALKAYWNNMALLYVYQERAEVIRQLRDRLEICYENVFKKLSDVFEALPGIFQQNLTTIQIRYRAAIERNLRDDTVLEWPLDYESAHYELNTRLDTVAEAFLEDLHRNMSSWVGADLENPNMSLTTDTDISGCISEFITKQFGDLLRINMEELFQSKLSGGVTLNIYVQQRLWSMMKKSVPMINMRPEFYGNGIAEPVIISVPENSYNLILAAKAPLYTNTTNYIKISGDNTRLSVARVAGGIPLYALTRIERMEAHYEDLVLRETTRQGLHLRPEWLETLPSPLPESTWTPGVYSNARVKAYNDRIRAAFDRCLENSIIVRTETGAELETEDGKKEQLDPEGLYKNSYGQHVIDNIREAVLRIPRLGTAIIRQAERLAP